MTNSEKKGVMLKISGVLTGCMKGTTKFDKVEKLHISVKLAPDVMKAFKADIANNGIYANANTGFIPKWVNDDKAEYINFKSNFDVVAYLSDNTKTTINKMLAEHGGITGSDVTVAVKAVEGAIYPYAIKFDKLKVTTFDDLFADADENPFN